MEKKRRVSPKVSIFGLKHTRILPKSWLDVCIRKHSSFFKMIDLNVYPDVDETKSVI